MHEVYMIGPKWRHIPDYERRQLCGICEEQGSMDHILTECTVLPRQEVWNLARKTWLHIPELWPNVNLSTTLEIGFLALPRCQIAREDNQQPTYPTTKERATLRLL